MQRWRLIERAQLLTALLLAEMEVAAANEGADGDLETLLLAYHALDAYNRRYGFDMHPGRVLDLPVA